MSENELIAQTEKTFEDIKHVDENGKEYWYARELQIALQYSEWRKFEGVIERAKDACKNSNINALDHFVGSDKIVEAGATNKKVKEYILTRYACYLIAQNGDARKKTIALAQTYFAVKTRQQEITEEQYKQLTEDKKRLYNRKIVKDRNKYLFDTSRRSGVKNYGKLKVYIMEKQLKILQREKD